MPKAKKSSETPLMKQYNGIKAKYPDALLLFRVGDFYETFGEDAIKASKILNITLTARKNGGAATIELAGFPHHSLDVYLPKLVKAGYRVAICDQLEDPKATKTIVKRGVTELVTPGVSFHDHILEGKSNNFLAAIHFEKDKLGVAFLDISTGEFLLAEGSADYIDKLLQGFQPNEVLHERRQEKAFFELFSDQYCTFMMDDWVFNTDFAEEKLLRQFGTNSLKGFGVEGLALGIIAAGAALQYLADTQHNDTQHIRQISRIQEDKYVWLDRFTVRNLELLHSPHADAMTLLDILDHTCSPMGSRMLRRWMVLPLKEKTAIEQRLKMVEYIKKELLGSWGESLMANVKLVGDLERLGSKAAVRRINPREVQQLKKALSCVATLKQLCSESENKELRVLAEQMQACQALVECVEATLEDEVPNALHKGGVIATGINAELDELKGISKEGKTYLLEIQQREVAATGITSLKIGYNNVFGYFLEVRNTFKDKVPETWIRKQTLTQAERYITEELKTYESKILGAEEKISALESRLFMELVEYAASFIGPIQANAQLVAQLDCLCSFAKVSADHNYVRPSITEERGLRIVEGRHPVIEQRLPVGEDYVPNDILLDPDHQQIMMITGPNMSGKSAILRQTALITLMAQMGCFVPAKAAEIGLVDKIFTRVGASDNISSGESTFMVEMNETASILNNLSDRSLILLDEIGRGTSTYDGVSIAWAIAEYLHEYPKARAKTLFATHYHELNEMASSFKRIKNFNVAVKEIGKKVIFLRTLQSGGSNHSFGIHVAKMAGMPAKVVSRAKQVLKKLEGGTNRERQQDKAKELAEEANLQLSIFQLDDPTLSQVKKEILATDINTLTPVEALMKLHEIQSMVTGKKVLE